MTAGCDAAAATVTGTHEDGEEEMRSFRGLVQVQGKRRR